MAETQARNDARALAMAMPHLCSPDGADYVLIAEAIGYSAERVEKMALRWVASGSCVRLRWPRAHSPSRLFATQALADAFVAANGEQCTPYAETVRQMLRELGGKPLTTCAFLARVAPSPAGTCAILSQMAARGEVAFCAVGRDRAYFATQTEADAFALRDDRWQFMPRWQGRQRPAPKVKRVKAGRPGAKQCKPERPSVAPGVLIKAKPAPIDVDYSRATVRTLASSPFNARYQALQLPPDPYLESLKYVPAWAKTA